MAKKRTYLTGLVSNACVENRFFFVLTSVLINYVVWQSKLKKIIPGFASVVCDVENLFDLIVTVSSSIEETCISNNSPLCRRWRARNNRRG
jgi:hypothetical protein